MGLKTSQFDMEDGHAVVTWIVDGKLSAGRKRFFRIIFEQEGVAASERIGVGKDEDALVVHGTGFTLRHDLRRAGAMVAATVADVCVELKPNDLVCDPQLNYYMPDNKAAQVRVLARGPLRTAIEVRASYYRAAGDPFKMSVEDRADAPDMAPISKPRVTYRYTTVLGMPVTRIDAFMIQDTPHPWREVEVGMFTFDRAFHNWALSTGDIATGKTTGVLAKNGLWHESGGWAAVHDRDFLIAIASATGVSILDMKGPSCLFRSAPSVWRSLQHRRVVNVFFGGGPEDLEKFRGLAPVLRDPPRAAIVVPREVQDQIEQSRSRLVRLTEGLASAGDEEYIAGAIVTEDAEQSLLAAEGLAAGGNFQGAMAKLRLADQTAVGQISHQLKRDGKFLSGRVGTSEVVANKQVAFIFADPGLGAGLTGIYDLAAHREVLRAPARQAPLWQIALKDAQGKTYVIRNRDDAAKMTVNIDPEVGETALLLTWQEMRVGDSKAALSVNVRGTLKKDERLLRWTIEAKTLVPELGLLKVTFPDLAGLKPISQGGESDWVLRTSTFGHRRKSPLQTGKEVTSSVPTSMQFTAVTDGVRGFYCAEEDSTAARKDFVVSPGIDGSTMDLTVVHPVLNWAAKELQRSYRLPGTSVMGPYCGGWYEACRLYQKWALTAPWCQGGPLTVRKDIPQWVKDIPSWRDQSLGVPYFFEHQEILAGLPYAAHLYGWMASPGFTSEGPYGEYKPAGGDEWFRRELNKAHESGIRVVPYTNGILWWTGLESFKTRGFLGAVKKKDGSYWTGGYAGTKFGVMCPGSKIWRDQVTSFCSKLVEEGVDGIYLDQLTTSGVGMWAMCYDRTHGHPLCGGNWWSQAAGEYVDLVRAACRRKDPQVIFTSEGICESLLGSFDIFLETTWSLDSLPLFPAVYGGYSMAFGIRVSREDQTELPYCFLLSRWFMWGQKGGWNGIPFGSADSDPQIDIAAKHLQSLLLCYDRFARPYLTYGQMMQPPILEGDIPKLLSRTGKTLNVPSVEAMAWRSLDGRRAGIFIANYSEEPRTVTWRADLAEELGWRASQKFEIRRWDHEALKAVTIGNAQGGTLRRTDELGPYELLVLELLH